MHMDFLECLRNVGAKALLKVSGISMAKSLRYVGISLLQLLSAIYSYSLLYFNIDKTIGFIWTDSESHVLTYLYSEVIHVGKFISNEREHLSLAVAVYFFCFYSLGFFLFIFSISHSQGNFLCVF